MSKQFKMWLMRQERRADAEYEKIKKEIEALLRSGPVSKPVQE